MIAAGSCHTGGPVLSLDGLDCPPLIAALAFAIRTKAKITTIYGCIYLALQVVDKIATIG
jgi:hypothetical protein